MMSWLREFFLVGTLASWLLAGCAGYAAAVLGTANEQEAVALAAEFSAPAPAQSSRPAEFRTLRFGLVGAAAGLAGLALWLTRHLTRQGYLGRRRTRGPGIWRGLARTWNALLPGQRRVALVFLVALTGLRVYVSRTLATFDDSASYEFFVRKSLLTVSAYYPSPNNHVLSNTLSWLFYQAYPGYWWSMRGPVLVLSTLSTAGWFTGLVRHTNFRVAAISVALFSLLEMSLFYAAEGRGYALLFAGSGLGFFCVLRLTDPDPDYDPDPDPDPNSDAGSARRGIGSAWAGLAVAGVAGLYTVPTFAFFLVAAYGWLALCWWRSAPRRLVSLGLLGVVTLLGTAVLYAPLLLVSGPGSLVGNAYIKPLGTSAFFRQLPAYVWQVEGTLLGESHNGRLAELHLGSAAAVAVVAGFLVLVGAARRGRLPADMARRILRVGVPALFFAGFPYVLLLLQRVQAPDRTLWVKAVFMFVLVGLQADWLAYRLGAKSRPWRAGLLLGGGLWAAMQLTQLYRSNELRHSYLQAPHAAARWLLRQPPGPILLPDSPWRLAAVRFFIHLENPTSPLRVEGVARPGVRYRYLIDPSAAALAASPPALPGLRVEANATSEPLNIVARW